MTEQQSPPEQMVTGEGAGERGGNYKVCGDGGDTLPVRVLGHCGVTSTRVLRGEAPGCAGAIRATSSSCVPVCLSPPRDFSSWAAVRAAPGDGALLRLSARVVMNCCLWVWAESCGCHLYPACHPVTQTGACSWDLPRVGICLSAAQQSV